jgi:hypothetical protein
MPYGECVKAVMGGSLTSSGSLAINEKLHHVTSVRLCPAGELAETLELQVFGPGRFSCYGRDARRFHRAWQSLTDSAVSYVRFRTVRCIDFDRLGSRLYVSHGSRFSR